jgi:hypothetical protein
VRGGDSHDAASSTSPRSMPLRVAVLLALVALALAVAWLLRGEPDPPGPVLPDTAPAAIASERTPLEIAPRASEATTPGAVPATAEPVERRDVTVAAGRGRLVLELIHPGLPVHVLPFVVGLIPDDPNAPDEGQPVFASELDGVRPASLELREGAWRLFVVRGPGDEASARESAFWSVELSDDLITVPRDAELRHSVRIIRADEEPPERGKARIRGTAYLDGRPAVDCMVASDPLAQGRVQRVAADGSFDLGEVAAGLQRVQLSQPAPGVRRADPVLLVAAIDVAPRAGEQLEMRIDAQTGTLEIETVAANGEPLPVALVLDAAPVFAVPGFGPIGTTVGRNTGEDGRHTLALLPAGSLRIAASSPTFVAPPRQVEIVAGETRRERIVLTARVPVRGTIARESFGMRSDRRFSPRGTLFFDGPIRESVGIRADGSFATDALIPGRYAVHLLNERLQRLAAEPITVGPAGLTDAVIVAESPARR